MSASAITLKRSSAMPFAPAPSAVRAGDYVFTSSIYPIDKAGHAIETDILLGEAGPSLIAAQTRHCLEALKAILKEHGSSLDRVLKAEVHLARIPSDLGARSRLCSGRDVRFIARPPAQNRTCGFPAYGSRLGCVTAKVAVYAPARLSREPGSGSSTCCAGAYSPGPRPSLHPSSTAFAPADASAVGFPSLCSPASIATVTRSDFSCPCIIGFGSSPSQCGPPYTHSTRRRRPQDTRSPGSGADPFARDVALDRGRASAPRLAVPHMLPSRRMKTLGPCDV